jgi:hypothetical protein
MKIKCSSVYHESTKTVIIATEIQRPRPRPPHARSTASQAAIAPSKVAWAALSERLSK